MKKTTIKIVLIIISFFCFLNVTNADSCSAKTCSEIMDEKHCEGSTLDGKTCGWRGGTFTGKSCKASTEKGKTNYINNCANYSKTNNTSSNISGTVTMDPKVNLCSDPDALNGFKITGYIITICKILAPLIIILTGTSNLAKSVIEDNDSKDAINLLIKKIFVGAFIFFIPTIINALLDIVDDSFISVNNFDNCRVCLLDTKNCDSITNTNNASDCTLFGNPNKEGDFAYYLQISFNIMKYIGLVLVIVLTIIDITKALSEQDKDLNKNLAKKFFTRLIILAVLFFLPLIVNLLMSLIDSAYSTCGLE